MISSIGTTGRITRQRESTIQAALGVDQFDRLRRERRQRSVRAECVRRLHRVAVDPPRAFVQDQARQLRSELDFQGFNVVRIKNHIDFGMEQTTILHRAGAAKVAQTLGAKFFKTAKITESDKLPDNVDVKVILGKDLPGGLDLMAKMTR